MKNEKWWTSYIDRTLLETKEFEEFYNNYDLIQSRQNDHQNREQKAFLKSQFQTKIIPVKYVKSRENEEEQKSPFIGYSYEIPINHYDESNRPKRLSVKQKNLSASLNNSPSKLNHSNSPSTASSSSKDYLNNTVSLVTTGSSNFISNYNDDFQFGNKLANINLNDDIYSRESDFITTNRKDEIYNYPSDNVFTYKNDPIHRSSGTVISQVYYPKQNYTSYSNSDYSSLPSAYHQQTNYVPKANRQTNLSPKSAQSRYANPKSIETPI